MRHDEAIEKVCPVKMRPWPPLWSEEFKNYRSLFFRPFQTECEKNHCPLYEDMACRLNESFLSYTVRKLSNWCRIGKRGGNEHGKAML